MKSTLFAVVLLGLFLDVSLSFTLESEALNLELIREDLNRIQKWSKTAKTKIGKAGFQDISFECGLCGIIVNEIEGFVAENKSEQEIADYVKNEICVHLGGLYVYLCDEMMNELPSIIAAIENKDSVDVVCVDRGYCTKPFSPHTDPVPLPQVTVNLDLPPNQRLVEICSNPVFQNISQYLVSTASYLLPRISPLLEEFGFFLNRNYFPSEYAQEIQGCASVLGVSEGWLAMFNIGYEVSDACTSIVAQTTDGKIYHARNLDFWDGMGFTASLKEMAIQIDYQKGGKTLFQAAGFAGYVGVLSGFKANAFSATVDTRFYPDGIGELFYEVVAAITEKNASLVTFLNRKVFATENDFESALNNLSNGELIADVYYILAGVSSGQGAVISRNRHNATDVWMLNTPTSSWFEVETNYDHWTSPPFFDDRVTPANNAMNAMGQADLTLQGMFNVLSTKPVFNLQTTYSILSSPADGTFQSWARYCPYPCVE